MGNPTRGERAISREGRYRENPKYRLFRARRRFEGIIPAKNPSPSEASRPFALGRSFTAAPPSSISAPPTGADRGASRPGWSTRPQPPAAAPARRRLSRGKGSPPEPPSPRSAAFSSPPSARSRPTSVGSSSSRTRPRSRIAAPRPSRAAPPSLPARAPPRTPRRSSPSGGARGGRRPRRRPLATPRGSARCAPRDRSRASDPGPPVEA